MVSYKGKYSKRFLGKFNILSEARHAYVRKDRLMQSFAEEI